MSQAITRYQALYDSLRSRGRKKPAPEGLDKWAVVAALRLRQRQLSVHWLRTQAEQIDLMEHELRNHSNAAFDGAVMAVREVFLRGRQDEVAVRRALAVTREAARRETGEEAYIVQLMGALALYHSCIVQMLTGEGKTLTGSLVAPLLAWQHRHLHVFTVNDYLAKRDAEGRGPTFKRLHLECGAIEQEQGPADRARIYARPIVYGTPKQIVADYLRDQLRLGPVTNPWAAMRQLGGGTMSESGMGGQPSGPIVPGLRAAMVDEADGVLIDEAVVPLIIAQSRRSDEMEAIYRKATEFAGALTPREHFSLDMLRRRVELTRAGKALCEELFQSATDPIWKARRRAEELVRQALVARHCYIRGRQYEVIDGRVQIIDEFTGRILADRSWEHGLHQSVEAKEGVDITADRQTIARMSFQRFYRMYPVLCGMTGTAADATGEMERTYQRKVMVIPTNRPVVRQQWPTRLFRSADAKWTAVIDSVVSVREQHRPVLVGTRSVEASELVSRRLAERGIDHKVLNAVHDKEEATLIANAGWPGVVTVATNMAGRGTDIKLEPPARKAGGLHVILTELHAAKRIDRQFIGRAGRQGDPGSAQIFASLQDELIGLYCPRAGATLRAATTGSTDELTGRWRRLASALFAYAQGAAQHRDRNMRSEVLRQDDWIEKNLPGM